jgi:hypothetical protein
MLATSVYKTKICLAGLSQDSKLTERVDAESPVEPSMFCRRLNEFLPSCTYAKIALKECLSQGENYAKINSQCDFPEDVGASAVLLVSLGMGRSTGKIDS